MTRFASALALLGAPLLAQAHEGHGIAGVDHWHATDTWGFLALAAVVAAFIWLGRRK